MRLAGIEVEMQSVNDFLSALQARRPILADGAMGTMLHTRGVQLEQCFDELNLSNPSLVSDIHREYIQAGADLIKTNTFGANRYKLSQHGLEHEVRRINQAAVDLALQAVASAGKKVFIAGDIGPEYTWLHLEGSSRTWRGLHSWNRLTRYARLGWTLSCLRP